MDINQKSLFIPLLGIGLLLAAAAGQAADVSDQTDDRLHGPLSADSLVAAVLESNPGLAALQAAVEEAAARIEPAGALDDPMLNYMTAPRTFGSEFGDRHVVQFSQAIPWPGKLGLRAEAAGHRTDADKQRLAAARLEVVALTRAAYAEWLFVHRALEINTDEQSLLEDLKESAEANYAAGRGAQQDVLRAERERIHARHRAIVYEHQRRSIRAQINALLNRPAEAPLPSPPATVGSGPLPEIEILRTAALEQHPELAELEAQLAASRTEVALAEKDFYPDFEVMTEYNSMWDPGEMRWGVGAGINLPIDRSKRRAAVDGAEAGALRSQWALADRRARLLADLESAHAQAAESQHIMELYTQRLVPLARETLNAALAAYDSGAGDFLSVVEAARGSLQAELELVRSRANYLRRLAELERWAGGGPGEWPQEAQTTSLVLPGEHHE